MITKACVIFHTVDGKIYEIPCHRHSDAYYIIKQFVNQNEILKEDTEEGFWNENAEFLDRFDAYREAVRCHQFIPENDKCKLLYSEDLY